MRINPNGPGARVVLHALEERNMTYEDIAVALNLKRLQNARQYAVALMAVKAIHIVDVVVTKQGRRTPVFKLGAGESTPAITAFDAVTKLLEQGPHTIPQMSEASGFSYKQLRDTLRKMTGQVHIQSWVRRYTHWIPVIAAGFGRDAKKPKPLPAKVINRAYAARVKKDPEKREQVRKRKQANHLRTRTFVPTDPFALPSGFFGGAS